MSQALAVIIQNRPHQTFRVGYDMQVAPLVAGEREQLAHYAGVKARLRDSSQPAPLRVEPAPLAPSAELALPPVQKRSAPLNMLTLPSWRFLVALAALRGEVRVEDILSTRRAQPISRARNDAIGLVYSHQRRSLPAIGRMFKRDHTTIMHSIRKVGAKALPPLPVEDAAPIPEKPNRSGRPPAALKVKGTGRAPTALQKAVRRAYQHGIPPSALAEEYGCSARSVKVIAWRMGLARNPKFSRAEKTAAQR